MGFRGRGGNFRGRGSRGSRGRGRGGGRGKSFSQFGPTRRFESGRLNEEDDDDELDDVDGKSDSSDAQDVQDANDNSSEDEDEEEQTSKRPYMELLQSLTESNSQRSKKQKVHHADNDAAESESDGDEDETKADVDLVDEAEEEEDDEADAEEVDEDSEDEEEATDPFDLHFAHPDEATTATAVSAVKKSNWALTRKLMGPLRATISMPDITGLAELPSTVNLDGTHLKQKLREGAKKRINKLNPAEEAVASSLFNYRDLLYCDRNPKNGQKLRQLSCLHALNHVLKTRDRVIKNNYKIAKEGGESELELRDQGFTRPKVLFLLPTRNSCAQMVSIMRSLYEPDQEENRKRFDESYISKEENFGQDRPEDFRDLFQGNDDDMFRIGVKFTRKTLKYFAQFYSSDILFASPLGLRMAIGSEEEKKKPDSDFLSSIEMVIVDQTDALLMQNWEHIEYIFEHMNLQPKDAHGCDFSRVRNWYLEDWAKYFRQTIILSSFNTPELAELQRIHCHNWAGKIRLQPEYTGCIQSLGVTTKQTFSRFQASSLEAEPDARFEYFVSAVVPSIVKRAKDAKGTLIFIPSYLDFVRVRNYFSTALAVSSVSFGAISEYTDVPEASRARSYFINGRHRVMLFSERAHHFRRYQIKGVQRIIFYGLPDNPIFYKEIAGDYLSKSEQDMIIEPGRGAVRVMFSKYDAMKLERTVGSKRVGKMIQDRGDTFEFL